MTADAVQNSLSSKAAHRAPAKPPRGLLEITRDEDFVAGRSDIFDLLARMGRGQENDERQIAAAMTMLERARGLLSAAEHKIKTQSRTISDLEISSGLCAVTGLFNRHGFIKAFVKEVARTNRGLSTGGLLVLFNLENYDRLLTDHGTDAANAALNIVARALEVEIRTMDTAARIEDDEFVLLFAETRMEKALSRLQLMALRLNKLALEWNGEHIRLSLSLGLKSYGRGERAEQIFKDASDDLSRNRKGTRPNTAA